jgi:hypothetical protein
VTTINAATAHLRDLGYYSNAFGTVTQVAIFRSATTSSRLPEKARAACNCQADPTALSSEGNDLRDPGEVSHGAVARSIPEVTSVDSALQLCSSVCCDRARF